MHLKKFALSAGTALLAGFLAWFYGLSQYPGYDASPLVDLAWRQLNGQRTHIDFFSPFPPTFGYPIKLAFTTLGVKWSSIILANAIGCAILVALGIYWWSLAFGLVSASIVFGLGAMQSMVFAGFWWHNTLGTMLCLVCAAGVVGLLKGTAHPVFVGIVMGAAMASKPNCTWPLLFFILLVSLLDLRKKQKVNDHLILWGTTAFISIGITELDGSLIGYIRDLTQIAQHRGTSAFGWNQFRGITNAGLLSSATGISFLLTTIAAISLCTLSYLDHGTKCVFRTNIPIRIGLLFSFSTSLALNNEALIVSLPLLTAALMLQPDPVFKVRRITSTLALVLLLIPFSHALQWTQSRERIRGAGPGTFWAESEYSGEVSNGFFEGTTTSHRLQTFTDEVQQALSDYPSAKVFFGPRVEFGYAAFTKVGENKLPLWWDRHQSWPVQNPDSTQMLKNYWSEANHDVLIFNVDVYGYGNRFEWAGRADMYDVPDFIRRDIHNRYTDISKRYGNKAAVVLIRNELADK